MIFQWECREGGDFHCAFEGQYGDSSLRHAEILSVVINIFYIQAVARLITVNVVAALKLQTALLVVVRSGVDGSSGFEDSPEAFKSLVYR